MPAMLAINNLKAHIRASIARAMYASSLYRWRHRGKVVVLMYHRVLTTAEVNQQSVQPGMYVLDNVFAQHMSFLKANFTVLSLRELLSLWKTGKWNEQARYCVVTFDDGWLDNYCHAYPILKRLRLPATIFLPTDYVGRDEWFWPDQLSFLLKNVRVDSQGQVEDRQAVERVLSPVLHEEDRLFVEGLARRAQVIDLMIERCKHLPIQQIRQLIAALGSVLRVPLPKHRVIVNWDEVREMSANGISFGSHSCSHRILTTVTSDEVSDELIKSREVLLGQRVNYVPVFCYPNGNSDVHIQHQVQTCGYEAAVSVQMGVEGRRPTNKFSINRVGIHNDVTSTQSLFAFRLFGPMPGSA